VALSTEYDEAVWLSTAEGISGFTVSIQYADGQEALFIYSICCWQPSPSIPYNPLQPIGGGRCFCMVLTIKFFPSTCGSFHDLASRNEHGQAGAGKFHELSHSPVFVRVCLVAFVSSLAIGKPTLPLWAHSAVEWYLFVELPAPIFSTRP
jgi:hypothetical protein